MRVGVCACYGFVFDTIKLPVIFHCCYSILLSFLFFILPIIFEHSNVIMLSVKTVLQLITRCEMVLGNHWVRMIPSFMVARIWPQPRRCNMAKRFANQSVSIDAHEFEN